VARALQSLMEFEVARVHRNLAGLAASCLPFAAALGLLEAARGRTWPIFHVIFLAFLLPAYVATLRPKWRTRTRVRLPDGRLTIGERTWDVADVREATVVHEGSRPVVRLTLHGQRAPVDLEMRDPTEAERLASAFPSSRAARHFTGTARWARALQIYAFT